MPLHPTTLGSLGFLPCLVGTLARQRKHWPCHPKSEVFLQVLDQLLSKPPWIPEPQINALWSSLTRSWSKLVAWGGRMSPQTRGLPGQDLTLARSRPNQDLNLIKNDRFDPQKKEVKNDQKSIKNRSKKLPIFWPFYRFWPGWSPIFDSFWVKMRKWPQNSLPEEAPQILWKGP